jgi:signal transduction histidine kinase
MRLLLRFLTSRISNKIILPYLLLALLLAVAVTFVAARSTTGTLQKQMDNRLIEAGRVTSDGLVAAEDQQIEQLRAMIFTQGVSAAFAQRDTPRLAELLRPNWANLDLFTLIAFDTNGQPLLSWQRAPGAGVGALPQDRDVPDLSSWWLVQQILAKSSDAFGDKFSTFRDDRLYTVAPVRHDGALVGGLMLGLPIDDLLKQIQSQSHSSVTTFYDAQGRAVATTQIVVGDALIPAISPAIISQLQTEPAADGRLHSQSVVTLNGRDYQFAYSPLQIRRTLSGYFSVALPRSFIVDTWATQRFPLGFLAFGLVTAVVGVGLLISRRITYPLVHLVNTARAVTNGELQQRSIVASHDELGLLARSFNQMTERLLHLYETSRVLSAHTHIGAILDQTSAATQQLVPETTTLTLLADPDGWRFYIGDRDQEAFAHFDQALVPDSEAILALIEQAERPHVAPINAPHIRTLSLPDGYVEVCAIGLNVQNKPIGLLLLLQRERGMFVNSVIEPLAAVASMAATSLHNTRLYLEVQAEGNRRRTILESIADAVVVCDADRYVVLMNPSAETLLKVHDWQQRRYHFDDLPLVLQPDHNALHVDDSGRPQTRYQAHGLVLSASSAVLNSPTQARAGEVIVLHNISAEAALDQAKTDLIALISHELRTPLTAIQSAAQMLQQGIGGQLSPLQSELASTAMRQSHAMSTLIEKAIMIANIETGALTLDLQPTGLKMVVETALQPLRDAAAVADVTLLVDIPDDLPMVLVDASMLKVAIQQVIDNAIKYGAGAPVRIIARSHGSGVVLAVRDFGPGIRSEALPQLFKRLQRHANSLNEAARGIGLGLIITRELLDRQGGAIQVQSELGRGSLFSMFLPGVGNAAHALAA